MSPIDEGTCRSFEAVEADESMLIPELEEVGDAERNILLRKPKPPKFLLVFGLDEAVGGVHVLEVLVTLG